MDPFGGQQVPLILQPGRPRQPGFPPLVQPARPPRSPPGFPPGFPPPGFPPPGFAPAPAPPAPPAVPMMPAMPENPPANEGPGGLDEAAFQAAQAIVADHARRNRLLQAELSRLRETMARIIARELQSTFARSRTWELEKFLGHGSFGVTVLLRDRDPLNTRHNRRLVLKRSIALDLGERDLINEMVALKVMCGNAHICQMIAFTPDTTDWRNTSSQFGRTVRRIFGLFSIGWFSNPTENIFRTLSVTGGPAMLLEFCENGDIIGFLDRVHASELHLPNRIIWSFLLCCVRITVGLAHPKNAGIGAPQELERVSGRPRSIMHSDIAPRNMVLHTTDKDEPEHMFVPKLKLIDFGLATEGGEVLLAIQDNLFTLLQVVISMILKRYWFINLQNSAIFNGVETWATGIVPPYDGHVDTHPTLDPDLQNLIVACMAVNEEQRPSLEETLRRAIQGAAKPPSAFIRGEVLETDEQIHGTMERLLYTP